MAEGCLEAVVRVVLGQANHIQLLVLADLGVVEGAPSVFLEGVAARDVPPAVLVLVGEAEIAEGEDRVLEATSAERRALEDSFFDVDRVVGQRAVLVEHGEDHSVPFVSALVVKFEPELDGVLGGPVRQCGGVESQVAGLLVESESDVLIVACDPIEELTCITEGATE